MAVPPKITTRPDMIPEQITSESILLLNCGLSQECFIHQITVFQYESVKYNILQYGCSRLPAEFLLSKGTLVTGTDHTEDKRCVLTTGYCGAAKSGFDINYGKMQFHTLVPVAHCTSDYYLNTTLSSCLYIIYILQSTSLPASV